jgi:hypothetical protein
MDPNATLDKILELMGDGDSADIQLVHAFNDLDEWLINGGFLPDRWKPRLPVSKATKPLSPEQKARRQKALDRLREAKADE